MEVSNSGLIVLLCSFQGDVDLIRLTPDGEQHDESFSKDGRTIVRTYTPGQPGFRGMDLDISADGSIVVLGLIGDWTTSFGAWVSRFNAVGAPASGFAPAGNDLTLPTGKYQPLQVWIAPSGDLLVGGSVVPIAAEPFDWFAMRLHGVGGAVDTSYGEAGFYRRSGTDGFVGDDQVMQRDGKIVFVGNVGGDANSSPHMFRLQNNADHSDMILDSRGTLIVTSSDAPEQVSLSIRNRDGRLVVRIGELAQSFAPSKVKRIGLFTAGGDDTVTIGPGVKGVYVESGDGDDTVNGGGGDDVILGGPGKDQLFGNDGDDKLVGAGGNDYLLGGAGKDDLFGNGGLDSLSGAGGNDRLFGGIGDADVVSGGPGTDSAADSPDDV
jgi:hypothetical protein